MGVCSALQVESYFYDIRKQLFEYDQVLNTQRDKVYGERRLALLTKDMSRQMIEYAQRTVDDILEVSPACMTGSEAQLLRMVCQLWECAEDIRGCF